MNLPFSVEELAAYTAVIVGTVTAVAELRSQIKVVQTREHARDDRISQLDGQVATLEAEVSELKEGQLAVALLEQAVASLNTTARSMNEEARATRETMETMGRSLVRIETKMSMESVPSRRA